MSLAHVAPVRSSRSVAAPAASAAPAAVSDRVSGFRAAGVRCGIKPSGAPDLALVVSDRPAAAAALFTTNQFPGAPVIVSRSHLRRGRVQAIVVNSGNANSVTGEQGERDAETMAKTTAESLRGGP